MVGVGDDDDGIITLSVANVTFLGVVLFFKTLGDVELVRKIDLFNKFGFLLDFNPDVNVLGDDVVAVCFVIIVFDVDDGVFFRTFDEYVIGPPP